MKTALAKATKANVRLKPFPHVVVENAIDEDLINHLIEELPTPEELSCGEPLGSNRHFMHTYKQASKAEYVTPLWKEFLAAHITQEFYNQITDLVGEHMNNMHKQIVEEFGPVENWRVGTRNIDTFDEHEILLDSQIFVQTPVVGKPDSYRIGHVDDPRKLYNALLYLRLPGDDSEGANLQLMKYRGEKKKFHNRDRKLISDKYVEVVDVIPYKANTFVVLPGSFNSLHGVEVRQKTKWPRYYMNLLGAVEKPLFDLSPYWENPFEALLRKVGM